jgi:ATP-dependent DNA helicase RecG
MPSIARHSGRCRRPAGGLVYDELMLMQLGLGIGKKLREGRLTAPVLRIDKTLDARIRKRFPFALTNAQQNCVWQIVRDLQSGRPMNRLLQGDVGSGKTVVAVYAMLMAVANQMQSAMLAPTEVLAEQHYLTLTNLLKDSEREVELFTAAPAGNRAEKSGKDLAKGKFTSPSARRRCCRKTSSSPTSAWSSSTNSTSWACSSAAVLKGKGLAPHYLVMTATPIPRTLALSYFADFEVSSIDELAPRPNPIKPGGCGRIRPPSRTNSSARRSSGRGRRMWCCRRSMMTAPMNPSRC